MHSCKESHRRDRVKTRGPFMLRRGLPLAMLLLPAATWVATGAVRADEDARTALEFVQELRERGFFDVAASYLDQLRATPGTPDDIRAVIDYEFGRLLIDEAAKTGDLVRRKELLEQARGRL